MKPLFTSEYCANECDKPKTEPDWSRAYPLPYQIKKDKNSRPFNIDWPPGS